MTRVPYLLAFADDGRDPAPGSESGKLRGVPAQGKGPRGVGAGYMLLATALLGLGVGQLLDRHYQTDARWTIGLGMAGILIGLYLAVREASR